MASYLIPPVQPGDALPFILSLTTDGRLFSLEEQTGRPAVVVLLGVDCEADRCGAVRELGSRIIEFYDQGADILVFSTAPVVCRRNEHDHDVPPDRFIVCSTDYMDRCGITRGKAVALVIDRNQRVVLRKLYEPGDNTISECLECIAMLPCEPPCEVSAPAPVLIVPNLLPPPVCQFLIDQFESRPSFDSQIASVDLAGQPCSRVDHAKKYRRDVFIAPEEPLHGILCEAILRRAAPEVAHAFNANVKYLDRLLIARYEANAGWFHRHRDNVARHVAFREFAVSINLGTDPFDGGDLQFPEYNDHRYRPPLGAALIFSCSLLHQVMPVTRGQRTVLLTFLHGDVAEARRVACAKA